MFIIALSWICWFVLLQYKKLTNSTTDDGVVGKKQITDLILSKAGIEAIPQVSLMAAPRELDAMNFVDIRATIIDKMRPRKKLVIAERTRFLALHQSPDEDIQHYAQRLRHAAKFCSFDKLNGEESTQPAEDELVQMRITDGIASHMDRL